MGLQWPDYTLAEANVDWVPGGDDDDDNADDNDGIGDGDIASHRLSQCDISQVDQLWTWDHGQMHKMVWHASLAVRHDVEKGLRAVYEMVWPAS